MKKPMLLVGSLLFVIIALSVVRITLVNSISTTGIELVDLQNQITKYNKDNELLKEKYLEAASYTNISAKAKRLGFGPQKSQIDMTAPLPLALKQ
jgi:cell division protein FtsL